MKIDEISYYTISCFINSSLKSFPSYPMYHYTSLDGLISILKNKTLWFSRCDCLNDSKERVYILEVYKEVCDTLLSERRIEQKFYDSIIDLKLSDKSSIALKKYNGMPVSSYIDVDYYLCCFSKNGDSLPMWHYYSKDNHCEGYNIECNYITEYFAKELKGLNELEEVTNPHEYIQFVEVIYDEFEQKSLLSEVIENMYAYCKKYGFDTSITHIKESIVAILSKYSLGFKSKYFSNEEECRIIIKVPKKDNNIFNIKYRTVRGCKIPYIEMKFDKNFILGVTIGPLVNTDEAKNSLKPFIENKRINISKIPIRY